MAHVRPKQDVLYCISNKQTNTNIFALLLCVKLIVGTTTTQIREHNTRTITI
jgi:hypothetical protein